MTLNSIGVGYGLWSTAINVDGHIESGNVEVVYDDCSILSEEPDNKAVQVQVCGNEIIDEQSNGNNKKLNIMMQNALPGDSVKINYTVKNIGTLPVNCESVSDVNGPVNINVEPLEKIDPPPYKSLDNKLIVDKIIEPNCKSGIITITIGQIEESKNYNYSLKLVFNNNSWDDVLNLSIMVEASDKFTADDNTDLINNDKESANAGSPNAGAPGTIKSAGSDDKNSKDNTGLINNDKENTNAGSPNAEAPGTIKSAGSDNKNSKDNTGLINNGRENTNTESPNDGVPGTSTVKDISAGGGTGIIDNKN